MDSLVTLQHSRRCLHLPADHFPKAPAPAPFRSSFTSPPSSSDLFRQTPRRRKPSFPQILHPISSSILKTTCVTFAAAAALFLMRFSGKPAIAAPNPPHTVESEKEWMDRQEDKARKLEEQLANNPSDVKVLGALMAVRFYASKLPEALNNVNRLIELEPNELKWPIWRGFVYSKMDDSESARNDFERVLEKDPYRFKAYQGLVYLIESSETDKLEAIQKRVEGVLENYKERVGRFKMLISVTKFKKGCYSEALNDLQELLTEDPKDFSPRLLLGHFLEDLGNNDGADKQYEICGELLPNKYNRFQGMQEMKSTRCLAGVTLWIPFFTLQMPWFIE